MTMNINKNDFNRYDLISGNAVVPDNYEGKTVRGIAAYRNKIWGAIASCFGFAVKCKDGEGETVYLIKASALKYLERHNHKLPQTAKNTTILGMLAQLMAKIDSGKKPSQNEETGTPSTSSTPIDTKKKEEEVQTVTADDAAQPPRTPSIKVEESASPILDPEKEKIIKDFTPQMVEALGGVDKVLSFPVLEKWKGEITKSHLTAPVMRGSHSHGPFLLFSYCKRDERGSFSTSGEYLGRSKGGWGGAYATRGEFSLGGGYSLLEGSLDEKYMLNKISRFMKGEAIGLVTQYPGVILIKPADKSQYTPKDAYLDGEELLAFMDLDTNCYEKKPEDGTTDLFLYDPSLSEQQNGEMLSAKFPTMKAPGEKNSVEDFAALACILTDEEILGDYHAEITTVPLAKGKQIFKLFYPMEGENPKGSRLLKQWPVEEVMAYGEKLFSEEHWKSFDLEWFKSLPFFNRKKLISEMFKTGSTARACMIAAFDAATLNFILRRLPADAEADSKLFESEALDDKILNLHLGGALEWIDVFYPPESPATLRRLLKANAEQLKEIMPYFLEDPNYEAILNSNDFKGTAVQMFRETNGKAQPKLPVPTQDKDADVAALLKFDIHSIPSFNARMEFAKSILKKFKKEVHVEFIKQQPIEQLEFWLNSMQLSPRAGHILTLEQKKQMDLDQIPFFMGSDGEDFDALRNMLLLWFFEDPTGKELLETYNKDPYKKKIIMELVSHYPELRGRMLPKEAIEKIENLCPGFTKT